MVWEEGSREASPYPDSTPCSEAKGRLRSTIKPTIEAPEGSWLTRCAKGRRSGTIDIPVGRPVIRFRSIRLRRNVRGDAAYPLSTADMIANAAVMQAIFKGAKEEKAQSLPT